jgi:hypothetical protein
MYLQKSHNVFILTVLLLMCFNFTLSAGVSKRNRIIITDNSINTLSRARFNLYFVNISNAISWCTGIRYKSKPIFVNFYKNSKASKVKLRSSNNRITLTINKNYTDLLDKATELKIINFMFLDRFDLKPSKENIKKIAWITSAILKKFTLFEGSDTSKVISTFPIVYKLMLSNKKLKISQIVNTFPINEAYGTPIYRLYEECSEILIYAILALHNGRSIIDNYVLKSCYKNNNIPGDVLYKILGEKISLQNSRSSKPKELEQKADEYLNRIAYKWTFNPRMPLPVQLSVARFNNLCNVKSYVKVGPKIIENQIKLNNLNQNIKNIINYDDLILYLINQIKILKFQSSCMLAPSLENIIKELYLLKERKNVDEFRNGIIKYEQQFYFKAEEYKKIARYLNSQEDELINMSIKYYEYIEIIRNENDLIKEVWPELYNYFMKL